MRSRVLAVGYWLEGRSDDSLIVPIVQRSITEWLCVHASGPSDLFATEVRPPRHLSGFVERVLALVAENQDWMNVLLVHSDAGAPTQARARGERVEPAQVALERSLPGWSGFVPVVPIRESEAWLLVSEPAIRSAVRPSRARGVLPIPLKARDVEKLMNPKEVLDRAITSATGSRPRSDERSSIHAAIARSVPLSDLRKTSAFRAFERDLDGALRQLHWL